MRRARRPAKMLRPRILFFSNWFAPGFKGGGSQLAAVNLVQQLQDEFEFWVITRDRDLGESRPYANIRSDVWIDEGRFHVRYQPPSKQGYYAIADLIRSTHHDLMHLNSFVSIPFAAKPLIFQKLRSVGIPVLISPHGEMSPRARAKKPLRKSIYLQAGKTTGMFGNAHWHATSSLEKSDILDVWGNDVPVTIAPILPPPAISTSVIRTRKTKVGGTLRCVFLSRIDRMKNLDFAIDLVSAVSNVTLDIYGPIAQADYWAECQARIAASKYSDAFKYCGSLPSQEVIDTLSQYDLLLQPSQSENFGYTILESLSAGCPVMISDQTPWRALERAGIGFDLPLGEPAQFHSLLMQMRDLDEAAHSAWRMRARKYALEYIKTSPAKAATRDMYMTILDGRSSSELSKKIRDRSDNA